MEKRTVLAVVLSVVVVIVWTIVQGIFFPPVQTTPPPVAIEGEEPLVQESIPVINTTPNDNTTFQAEMSVAGVPSESDSEEVWTTLETDLLTVIFSNKGGDIVSFKLKEHNDHENLVEMVLPGDKEPHAFSIAFGNMDAAPVQSTFQSRMVSPTVIEYFRDFDVSSAASEAYRVRLTKRYEFVPGEYLFQLSVAIDGGAYIPKFTNSNIAYTLYFGPQIGPAFAKLDSRYEYRNYVTYQNGKRKDEKVNGTKVIDYDTKWAAITGKYFTAIALPDNVPVTYTFSTRDEPGLPAASKLYMTRPALTGSKTVDTYRFYIGPKNQKNLAIYDNANNHFKLKDTRINTVAATSGFLGPLETLLKWLLQFFQNIVHNWGVAIILLTLLVKILFFPLTKKSSETTLRMQALNPKIQELQTKYKDNPQKLNVEMAELYKKEGANPLSGCLPMLLQMPIFFAMYNLFNNHFDLRGAMFIPGWIPDLSRPESVWNFAPFKIPILGWSDLRLLPIIYVASQLLYGKVTQTPDQKSNNQMKIMLYAMPIMFFFILYDVPSGLLVYWIMSNILTMVQQLTINKYMVKRKAEMAAAEKKEPVIAPRKKKK